MEFNTEQVYTILNAHEARVGSKGYFADDIVSLREQVCDESSQLFELAQIMGEDTGFRFVDREGNYGWHLFYLVESVDSNMCTEEELAQWLAQGKGLVKHDMHSLCRAYQTFELEDAEKPVSPRLMVRKWGETDWHKPTKEYIGGNQ